MIRSLYTASTGMKANQLYMDNISNNLANVNTTGFKKNRMDFEDLIYQTLQEPGLGREDGTIKPTGLQVGLGVTPVANQRIFTQGNVVATSNPFDVAIQGDGFFQVRLPSGETAYSRDGSFKLNADGYLTNSQGYIIEPGIVVPDDQDSFAISTEGQVRVHLPGAETSEVIGEIELARFINPAGLKSAGGNLFKLTEASGLPIVDAPGQGNHGLLQNQYLETSNVQLVEEMVSMIVAQRAYEVSSKSITAADEMLTTANQLKR